MQINSIDAASLKKRLDDGTALLFISRHLCSISRTGTTADDEDRAVQDRAFDP